MNCEAECCCFDLQPPLVSTTGSASVCGALVNGRSRRNDLRERAPGGKQRRRRGGQRIPASCVAVAFSSSSRSEKRKCCRHHVAECSVRDRRSREKGNVRSDAPGFPSGGIWCISVELSEDDFTRFASHSSCRGLQLWGGVRWIRRVGVAKLGAPGERFHRGRVSDFTLRFGCSSCPGRARRVFAAHDVCGPWCGWQGI